MILYRINHTGAERGLTQTVAYTRRPADRPETDIIRMWADLDGYTIGGERDDPCMVFDAAKQGYSLTYDRIAQRITLADYANRIIKTVSTKDKETVA